MRRSRSLVGGALVAAIALGACGGGDAADAGSDATIEDPTGCVIDDSRDAKGAIAIGSDRVDGQVCPRGDVDWYAIDVPAGMDLLDLTAGYPSAPTRVAIVAQLFAADGTTAVPDAQIVDTRTGVRKGTLTTTVRVPAPGKYLIAVRDGDGSQSDSLNSYVLSAVPAKDPDTHEPNDTVATAKAADGVAGWLAYRGDHDRYRFTVPPGTSLVNVHLDNPAAAKGTIHYALTDAKGNVGGEGDAPPSATALDVLRPVPGGVAGEYFLDIAAAPGVVPDRTPGAGYTLMLTTRPELDANDKGAPNPRNDDGGHATCLFGAVPASPATGCDQKYAAGTLSLSGKGQIGSLGDRDVFRFDVASGVPAVVELSASTGDTKMQLAMDLLVPDANSDCTRDSECAAINKTCSADSDCEMSHSCLPPSDYKFCQPGQPCRLCAGGAACVPLDKPGGKMVCAAPQFLVHDTDNSHALRTAQPLFATGPAYVVVHDFQDDQYDYGKDYSLDVRIVPEPDPNDLPAAAAMRNNLYNPYPMQMDDQRVNLKRARDATDDLMAGRTLSGFISYASDEDWWSFKHPCPGMNCGLVFEWTQPGPTPVRVAFLMRRDDAEIHESWTYTGNIPTVALPAPVTSTFGEGDCHECSFASQMYAGSRYFVQVRAVGGKSWDGSGGGAYGFRLKSVTPGCPAQCGEGPMCGCYCKALNMCPPGPEL